MAAQLKAGLAAPRTVSSAPTLMASLGRALSFSHLAGLGRGGTRKPKASGDDEREEEEEEDGKPKDKKGKKGKAEGGDEEAGAEGGNEDDEHEDQDRSNGDSKKGKSEKGDDDKDYAEEENDKPKDKKGKSKKADDSGESEDEEMEDGDDEEEMRGNSPIAQARRRERQRCAAIFNDRAAARNPQLAAKLAFNTTLSRAEALDVLRGTPASGAGQQQRADRNPHLGPGGELGHTSAQASQASWDRAMKQVRPDLK
ncbi:MAG TPA: hypothetical protein VFA75_03175 [Nevskia sp.]|nr:hypothetical protein [Nevskia sp.]